MQNIHQTGYQAPNQKFFFTTSKTKLTVMSICTFGFYDAYWFYQNYQLIKNRRNIDIWPFWRAFFSMVLPLNIFSMINNEAKNTNIQVFSQSYIDQLAYGYLALFIISKIPVIAIFALARFFIMVQINQLAWNANASIDPGFNNNNEFTMQNFIFIILGGFLLIFKLLPAVLSSLFFVLF